MRTVRATVQLDGLASAAEAVWYDTTLWPVFVDGMGEIVSIEGGWPAAGGTVVWDSHPGGRGRVHEQVIAFESRRGQESSVEDPEMRGIQRISFVPRDDKVVVTLELEYEIRERSVFTPVVDVLFVRSAQTASLRRTLDRFAQEVAAVTPADDAVTG
jgi:Polyketide cyclase / dehydrase and lipid transport